MRAESTVVPGVARFLFVGLGEKNENLIFGGRFLVGFLRFLANKIAAADGSD
jgi:hypothetical protein